MKLFRRSARHRQAVNRAALDRATLDRVLEGDTNVPPQALPAEVRPVVRVLRAAAAPAHPEELRGEFVARAGFRAARLHPSDGSPKRASGAALTRLLSMKVLAIILGTAATAGGVALAASNGVLPDVLDPGDSVRSTTAEPKRTTRQSGPGQQSQRGSTGVDTPTVVIENLCVAYLAKSKPEREKALTTPEFVPLVQAADGPQKVDNFCEKLPRQQGSRAPGPQRSVPGPPSGAPGQQHSAPGQNGQPNPAPSEKPPARRTASPDR